MGNYFSFPSRLFYSCIMRDSQGPKRGHRQDLRPDRPTRAWRREPDGCCEATGKPAAIGQLGDAQALLAGQAGTLITC